MGIRVKAFYGARDRKFLWLDKILYREVLCLPAEMSFTMGEIFSKGFDECRLCLLLGILLQNKASCVLVQEKTDDREGRELYY